MDHLPRRRFLCRAIALGGGAAVPVLLPGARAVAGLLDGAAGALPGSAACAGMLPATGAVAWPPARVEPVSETFWGETVVDPYRWMENPADPDWLPFMQAQTAVSRQALDCLPHRASLLRRIGQLSGDLVQASAPRSAGGRLFYLKREVGAAQFRLVVVLADGSEPVVADPAQFASGETPASLDWWQPSPDGRQVVFGISLGGSEAARGHVAVIDASGAVRRLPQVLEHVPYAAPSWLPDGSGFFYNRFAGRAAGSADYYNDQAIWLHRPGTAQARDQLIVGRLASAQGGAGPLDALPLRPISAPELQCGVDSDHVALAVRDGYVRSFDLYLARRADLLAGTPHWRRVCSAGDGVTDYALSGASLFLISTRDAPRGRLLLLDAATAGSATTAARPGPPAAAPHELLAQADAVLEELNASGSGVYLTLNEGGQQRLVHVDPAGRMRPIALPYSGWIQSVAPVLGAGTGGGDEALVRISSWLEPATIFRVCADDGSAAPSALQPRPALDLSRYETRRIYAIARDGTQVPISVIVRRAAAGGQGRKPAPCLVHAYGAYQWPSQPSFDVRALAFLEAGGMIATAHVRGGGEYGRAWHEAGMKANKPNTWRDLIACSEKLIADGYTAAGRIALVGGSAGGIAVGRAMTERPELFGAVISKAGMSNPLRAEFEPNGQPNIPEFGSVATRGGFEALLQMDAYQAIRAGRHYPAMLLETGINDARVAPHNAAKMAARMQAADPQARAYLRVDFDGGHVANNDTRDRLDAAYADEYAFILHHLPLT